MSGDQDSGGLTYREAGVDIDAGAALVERIRADVATTHRPGVLGGLGGFGGLFELPLERFRHPVLVSGTDGVGTKLKLAIETGRHEGIGIDLVAMCANDVVVTGAEPLFFLDYYATGQLDVDTAATVIRGIAEGCRQAGAALIGGETAEMPGMYGSGDFDLAGFCVGVVEKEAIVDGRDARPGDALIAVASSGAHSNGYSLIRRIVERSGADLGSDLDGRSLGEVLMEPTRIYVRAALELCRAIQVRAICHVTGGGLPENLPRVLPDGLGARIDGRSWQWPALFRWLRQAGGVTEAEMHRTFNCGVGMVFVVPAPAVGDAVSFLQLAGERAWHIGDVITVDGDTPRIRIEGAA